MISQILFSFFHNHEQKMKLSIVCLIIEKMYDNSY